MNFSFGKTSTDKLITCDKRIKAALYLALSYGIIDISIVYGHRNTAFQFNLFTKGRKKIPVHSSSSKKFWVIERAGNDRDGIWEVDNPKKIVTNKDGFVNMSKHNFEPSLAVDAAPYINGAVKYGNNRSEYEQILVLSGIIQAAFAELKIDFRWGGNWDKDGEPLTDQTFQDLLHFEVSLNT